MGQRSKHRLSNVTCIRIQEHKIFGMLSLQLPCFVWSNTHKWHWIELLLCIIQLSCTKEVYMVYAKATIGYLMKNHSPPCFMSWCRQIVIPTFLNTVSAFISVELSARSPDKVTSEVRFFPHPSWKVVFCHGHHWSEYVTGCCGRCSFEDFSLTNPVVTME